MLEKGKVVLFGTVIVFAAFSLGKAESAFANGGPHEGTFTLVSDACAGCHRAHTASGPSLLIAASQYDLCTSCHDGTGANTKVTSGVYLGISKGVQNSGLKGGGFEQALMNTAASGGFNQTGTPANITSRHSVGNGNLIAWGSNQTGIGGEVTLECSGCHNPHGNGNYRMLRSKPTSLPGWESLPAINITAGIDDHYTVTYNSSSHYRDLIASYSTGVISNIGDWCTQCHARFKAGRGAGSNTTATGSPPDNWPAGTPPYLYRHPTMAVAGMLDDECISCHRGKNIKVNSCTTMCHTTMPDEGAFLNPTGVPPHMEGECLACHVAHGTSSVMLGYAAGLSWPDGNVTKPWQTGEGQFSRLLTVDNRGVCLQCHINAYLTGN